MSIPKRAVYATQPAPLRNQIADLLKNVTPTEVEGDIMAVIVPDSNRLSGGRAAAEVYRALEGKSFENIILIAPSHEGAFDRINICSLEAYRTPLGDVAVNDRVRNELCDEDDDIFLSDEGHFHVEGIDVQLPFLQTILQGFDIVPIVMGGETPEFCRELGHAVGEVMYNRPTLVVASVDLLDGTEEKLAELKGYFEAGDVSRLMALVNAEEVRVEGKGALIVALIAALHRRANRFKVVRLEPPQGDRPGVFAAVLSRL